MRVLVCGDRNWTDRSIIYAILNGYSWATDFDDGKKLVLIEGGARGADRFAAMWASLGDENDEPGQIEHLAFPADWERYGKGAGPIRNQQMLTEGQPDVVLAFHDNLAESRGTADMVRRAKAAGVPVYVIGHGPEVARQESLS